MGCIGTGTRGLLLLTVNRVLVRMGAFDMGLEPGVFLREGIEAFVQRGSASETISFATG